MRFSKLSPVVLQYHKSDTSCCCRIQFCIMEPAVHVYISVIIQCPIGSHCCSDIDSDKVHAKCCRKDQETGNTARFGSSCDFIHYDKSGKYQQPSKKLPSGCLSVDLKKHTLYSPSFVYSTSISLMLNSFPCNK